MRIVARGNLAQAKAGTNRACLTFPTVTCLSNGVLLGTGRAGASKDAEHEYIELYRSTDGGKNWSEPWAPFDIVRVGGRFGTLKLCYLTQLSPGRILAASMWVDRTTYPGKPLFNADTGGCLPMAILLAQSVDEGETWTPWREVALPSEIGPPSLTSPILKLADGVLAMSVETNKNYHDNARWQQKAVFLFSHDGGETWSAPLDVAVDASGRIFNWDLRCGVAPDERICSFAWTYDTKSETYLNVHRRVSVDQGQSWSPPEDMGFADQAARPAMLTDGRVVLAWVDRFDSQTIRARIAPSIDAPFDPATEIEIFAPNQNSTNRSKDTGDLLADMSIWNFGLPYAEALPDGDVLVTYYTGTLEEMNLCWVCLAV